MLFGEKDARVLMFLVYFIILTLHAKKYKAERKLLVVSLKSEIKYIILIKLRRRKINMVFDCFVRS